MNRPPAITRATVSIEYDDGTTIVQYQEATPYRHVNAETESHGLDGATTSIYFSGACALRTTPEATAQGRGEAAAVLDAAKTLTTWPDREEPRTKTQTFLAWLNKGGAVRRGSPPPAPAKRPGNTTRISKD